MFTCTRLSFSPCSFAQQVVAPSFRARWIKTVPPAKIATERRADQFMGYLHGGADDMLEITLRATRLRQADLGAGGRHRLQRSMEE